MTYAKFISELAVNSNLPRRAIYNGRVYAGNLAAIDGLPESLGFFPLEESPEPEPREGFHAEKRYAQEEGKIVQTWVFVENPPPPPRVFSKRKLYRTLSQKDGLWESIKAYIEETGAWDDFILATTLDEDDPLLVAAIAALKTRLGLTDEQVEEILSASVTE